MKHDYKNNGSEIQHLYACSSLPLAKRGALLRGNLSSGFPTR